MKSVQDSLRSVGSKLPLAMLALLLSYTALAWLGLQWAVIRGAGSPVWPASGLALAVLMMCGIRLWPAILLGRLLAGWLSGSQQPFWAELLLASANTLAAVLPLMLTRKRGLLKPGLHDLTALLNYLVWGCLAGALIAAPLGTAALALSSELSVPAMIATLSNWIIAYFVGAILVGPLLLSWLNPGPKLTRLDQLHLAVILLVTVCFASLFLLPTEQAFLRTWHVFPVLVWAALAFELRGATLAVAIIATVAIWAADHGLGQMTTRTFFGPGQMPLVQQFIAVTALTSLTLAVVADERRAKNALAEKGRRLRLAEEEARARAEELEVVLAEAPVAIWVARDPDCNEIIGNSTSAKLLRLHDRDDNLSKSKDTNRAVAHFTVFDADGRELAPNELPVQRAARGEVVRDFEERIVFSDGSAVSLLGSATPLFDKDGDLRGSVAAFLDITDRKAAESREHLLAREVDHRAKNIMAVIQAIVQLTDANDIASYRKAISGRIGSLARSHTILADNRWDGAELRDLIDEELAPYLPHQAAAARRVTIDGPRLKLKPMTAQSIALIVHELITNALKHGSLSRQEGRLTIEWQVEGDLPDQRLWLRWVEQDGPVISAPGTANFGLALIETTAQDQLYGKINSIWNPDGLTVELAIPIGDLFRSVTPRG
jgi:two-component sensor histidine kinase/integral membrane sensor domain MASE1